MTASVIANLLEVHRQHLAERIGAWGFERIDEVYEEVTIRAADGSAYFIREARDGEPQALPDLAVLCMVEWP